MTRTPFTFAAIYESIAQTVPDAPAILQGDREVTWGQYDSQADGLAQSFIDAGLTKQSKVACYLANVPEYLLGYYGAFKAGMAPYNVNYRYGAEEVAYLLDNGDAEAVIFDLKYADIVSEVMARSPKVRLWLAVGEGDLPEGTTRFDDAAATTPQTRPVMPEWGRSEEDLLILFTGGTTGMPKGVMWQQGDLLARSNYGENPAYGLGPMSTPEEAGPRIAHLPIRPRSLVACPLMHGTGQIAALTAMMYGGAIVLLPEGKFSAEGLWDTAEKHRATRITIVGQPFAAPMLEALEANPSRWDLSSVMSIGSSGAMWNRENKLGLIKHIPQVMLTDSFSSSEAFGMGMSTMTATEEIGTGKFEVGPTCAVFDEDGKRVEPGSGKRGLVALGGPIPLGYYKDPAKTAKTFPTYEGLRWSVPGDWAEVNADGTLTLLGRGSQCINTGGEKVFPEEVEEALKRHGAVWDVAVAGLPDPRFGERVAAMVEIAPNKERPTPEELMEFCKSQLANYKAPRHILFTDKVFRAPNGKLDYKLVKANLMEAFAEQGAA